MRKRRILLSLALTSVVILPSMRLAHATSLIQECMDAAYVYNLSDIVVQGEVTNVVTEREFLGGIFTYITVAVREYKKGSGENTLVIRQLGGKMGMEEMLVAGAPTFIVGQQGYFFLKKDESNSGSTTYYDTTCMYGVQNSTTDLSYAIPVAASENQTPVPQPSQPSAIDPFITILSALAIIFLGATFAIVLRNISWRKEKPPTP